MEQKHAKYDLSLSITQEYKHDMEDEEKTTWTRQKHNLISNI